MIGMHFSRRDLGRLALAALPIGSVWGAINSTFNGVRVGINSVSFRGLPVDQMIGQVAAAGIGLLEMESSAIEPAGTGGRGPSPERREALRKWRLGTPLDEFRAVKKKMDDAGVVLAAYNNAIDESFTDEEVDRVFEIAQALGAQALVVPATMPTAQRLVPFAARHKLRVGIHRSMNAQALDAIGSPESFRKVLALAPSFGITLDSGQYASWGPDPMAFVAEVHDRIFTVHTHDRKTSGANVPFGEGDVPVKDLLLLMKKGRYNFVTMIERSYPLNGSDMLAEAKRSLQYFKDVLAWGEEGPNDLHGGPVAAKT